MRTVGIVVSPGFQVFCLGVMAVFEYANESAGDAGYQVVLVSEGGGPVATSQGFSVETLPYSGRSYDTLIVTGDPQCSTGSAGLHELLRAAVPGTRRVTSTCTGAFVLAQAGLLDGKRATTHWHFAREFRKRYPAVTLDEDRIFVTDGTVWTSAGMSAGIDLALALIEQDLGAQTSRQVARKLVLSQRRAGGQSQYSALLELDAKSDRIQTVLAYAQAHLDAELSVEELAEVAHLSPRQFSRVFREETGQSPAKAVENLRLEAARTLMESGRYPLEVVARSNGFGDRERMRRAFLRAFGQSPQALQRSLR